MLRNKKKERNTPDPIAKLFSNALQSIRIIGKPFYYILSFLVIAVLFLLYFIGHTATSVPERLIAQLKKIQLKNFLKTKKQIKHVVVFKAPKFSFPRFKLPRLFFKFGFKFKFRLPKLKRKPQTKIDLPKFEFPKLRFFRINISKFRLLFLKIISPSLKALFVLTMLIFVFWFTLLKDLPSATELTTRNQQVSTKIYDRKGILLYTIYKNQNRSPIDLSRVPQSVRLATLAAEDATFYSHPGFSIRGILRSVISNAKRGELSGGSTITQQLVKNALLSPEKTLVRKIRELILSLETELIYTKDQILEMYLNEVSYGGTAYGIEEASELYFGKKTPELTLAQAAFLAGLPKGPTQYSPYGTNPGAAVERQHEVLDLMLANKFITRAQLDEAVKEDIKLLPNRSDIKAPHFVMYVKQQLVDTYGEEMVEQGGLEVTTTLDYEIQKMAEEVVARQIAKAAPLRVGNGGVVVLDPATGEILAMIGSKDYFDSKGGGQVNVTTALRQPGSSIKVVNYLYALMHGYTAASVINDTPVTFMTAGSPPYSPVNYDGKFKGRVSLRTALAESRNIPAVRVLAGYGVAKMIELGTQMGITTWSDTSRFGISLTLGGGETKLLELARVYATIANYGKRPETISILNVKNYKGKVLENNKCAGERDCRVQVADAKASFILIDILKDNAARAPEFGSRSALYIPNHPEVAVKTGTSNDLKDNLTIGFTSKYLTAVWVGNNDSSPMSRIASGITGAAPIWNEIMTKLLAQEESANWQAPEGVVQLKCGSKTEWFIKGTEPGNYCTVLEEIKKQNEATPSATPKPDILDTGASTRR